MLTLCGWCVGHTIGIGITYGVPPRPIALFRAPPFRKGGLRRPVPCLRKPLVDWRGDPVRWVVLHARQTQCGSVSQPTAWEAAMCDGELRKTSSVPPSSMLDPSPTTGACSHPTPSPAPDPLRENKEQSPFCSLPEGVSGLGPAHAECPADQSTELGIRGARARRSPRTCARSPKTWSCSPGSGGLLTRGRGPIGVDRHPGFSIALGTAVLPWATESPRPVSFTHESRDWGSC